ncbi:chemotaxis-specific protein-glutamate methyltransferase CheB [Halobellus ordinarius]|uniref:chemotaxis-specific protein-glutamate methyltransferase CheB n=1 Tax=Halobellus ordinarius TaxID=3075120 RepID=UPI00288091C7|nr:chemotaxis-specific protein-glutamate methyltransferase CheB [Halobellus sp. ZY16]
MSTASESGGRGSTTRAVIVDDSRFMRTLIRRLLEEGGIEVVGEADDGSEAVDAVVEYDPDVVTMDIEMPTMNGIEAVEAIMDEHPTPVLMLSAHAEEDADVTFEALDRGAVDFVTKPGGEVTSSMPQVKRELVEKVESAARVDLSANARMSSKNASAATSASTSSAERTGAGASGVTTSRPSRKADSEPSASAAAGRSYPDAGTLVIGASTGGPNVVERVLSGLPRAANLRVLVVQHMPEGFTGRFSTRLDDKSEYTVQEAEESERIGPGEARVAPGGHHLVVSGDRNGRLRLELTETEPIHGVRPAVDLVMASAAENAAHPLCAVLLTGMGRDGVDGMGRIADAGGHTIAQDEATSAIFGMPKRAIETGSVETVAPAEEIAENALQYFAEE